VCKEGRSKLCCGSKGKEKPSDRAGLSQVEARLWHLSHFYLIYLGLAIATLVHIPGLLILVCMSAAARNST